MCILEHGLAHISTGEDNFIPFMQEMERSIFVFPRHSQLAGTGHAQTKVIII